MKAFSILACAVAGLAFVAGPSSARSAARSVITVTPVRPYQPGDQVVTGSASSPSTASTASIEATGCQRLPSSGYLATGSIDSTTAEYANHWEWSGGSSAQPYTWWIKKNDGTTVLSGSPSGAGGAANPPANTYYFRIQNRGAVPQAWNVCYDVL